MAEPSDDLARTASRLWAGALEAMHLRVQLFALELDGERRRLRELLLSALVLVGALALLALSVNVALLAIFWDTHRVAVAVGACVFYAALAVAAGFFHRRRSRRESAAFAATASVLSDDERALRELL